MCAANLILQHSEEEQLESTGKGDAPFKAEPSQQQHYAQGVRVSETSSEPIPSSPFVPKLLMTPKLTQQVRELKMTPVYTAFPQCYSTSLPTASTQLGTLSTFEESAGLTRDIKMLQQYSWVATSLAKDKHSKAGAHSIHWRRLLQCI